MIHFANFLSFFLVYLQLRFFHFKELTSYRSLSWNHWALKSNFYNLKLILFTICSENRPNFCWHVAIVHKICKNFKERKKKTEKAFSVPRCLSKTWKLNVTKRLDLSPPGFLPVQCSDQLVYDRAMEFSFIYILFNQ